MERICKYCQKPFNRHLHGNRLYCSEACADEAKKERDRISGHERWEAYKERHPKDIDNLHRVTYEKRRAQYAEKRDRKVVTVLYPGVACEDRMTKAQFEHWKFYIPAGSQVTIEGRIIQL